MIVHPDGFSISNNNGRHKLLKKRLPYIFKKYEYINVTLKVAHAFKLRAFQRLHLEASSGCNQLQNLVFVMTSVKKPASCT
jgi:hypothetical protein